MSGNRAEDCQCAPLKALVDQILNTPPQGIKQRAMARVEATIAGSEPLANGAISAGIGARSQ